MEEKTQKNAWKYLDVVLILVSLILSFFAYQIITSYYSQADQPLEKIVEEQKEKEDNDCLDCKQRAIDGLFVLEGEENNFPLAVAIENHTEARPQAGLSKANLVIEAEVEGGITRFLAFFANGEKPDRIGPIRSARPYFVDWATGLSSLYVHVGGSPAALAKIIKENVLDLNEFYNEKYFWRDEINDAPHNVFTSGQKMEKYLSKKGLDNGNFIAWEFKDDAEFDDRGDIASVVIDFERDMYGVEWKYNKEENLYIRFMAGEPHKDEAGELIKAKNIAIAYIEVEVLDLKLRLKMSNIGEGKSVLCMDGYCNEGTWKKQSSTSRMRFYNNNKELIFNRGTTWIEILKPEIDISY